MVVLTFINCYVLSFKNLNNFIYLTQSNSFIEMRINSVERLAFVPKWIPSCHSASFQKSISLLLHSWRRSNLIRDWLWLFRGEKYEIKKVFLPRVDDEEIGFRWQNININESLFFQGVNEVIADARHVSITDNAHFLPTLWLPHRIDLLWKFYHRISIVSPKALCFCHLIGLHCAHNFCFIKWCKRFMSVILYRFIIKIYINTW